MRKGVCEVVFCSAWLQFTVTLLIHRFQAQRNLADWMSNSFSHSGTKFRLSQALTGVADSAVELCLGLRLTRKRDFGDISNIGARIQIKYGALDCFSCTCHFPVKLYS